MIEDVASPEEALWRQTILTYAGEVFRIKMDVDHAKDKYRESTSADELRLLRLKRAYEQQEFKLQKLRLELFPITTEGGQKLPLYEVCENANVDFVKFREEMLKIIDDVRGLPEGARKHLPKT